MTKRIAMLAAVLMVSACGAETPDATCDVRDVATLGPMWPGRDVATCGEFLTPDQILARCTDDGEYFVPFCRVGAPGNFPATCGSDSDAMPECYGEPFGEAEGGIPTCFDVCPRVRELR
ncbi:MAG: hypothetical protein WC211_00870 [Dehalococcoidia bacterium]